MIEWINLIAIYNSSNFLSGPLGLQTFINTGWTLNITYVYSLRLPEAHQQTNTADGTLFSTKSLSQSIHLKTYQSIHTWNKPFACSRCDKIFPHLVMQRNKRVPIKNISPFQAHYVTGLSLYFLAWRDIRGTIQEIGLFPLPNVTIFSNLAKQKTPKNPLALSLLPMLHIVLLVLKVLRRQ